MLSFFNKRNRTIKDGTTKPGIEKQSSSSIISRLHQSAIQISDTVKRTVISSAVSLRLTVKSKSIKTTAIAIFANLPVARSDHDEDVDPYHLGCAVSRPVWIVNPSMNYSLQQGAFVYCKKFFEILDPFTREKFFPQLLADGFHNQNCTLPNDAFSLSYNSMCSTAGTVRESWPYYATHVIAENLTCLIDGVRFAVLPKVAYCFTQLTDLAAKNASEIQVQLNRAYEDHLQSAHNRNMALLGAGAVAAVSLVAYGVWHYRRSQYTLVDSVAEDEAEMQPRNRNNAAS